MTAEIQEVQLSFQVIYYFTIFKLIFFQCLLKIMQHARDFAPDFVTGQLLGMDTDSSLEVSDSFPFASNITDEVEQEGIRLTKYIHFIFIFIRVSNRNDEKFA